MSDQIRVATGLDGAMAELMDLLTKQAIVDVPAIAMDRQASMRPLRLGRVTAQALVHA